jgi:hypothetical protein
MNPPGNQGDRRRKRHRNAGTMTALKRRVWRAVCEAEDILDLEESPPELRLKAIHALATCAQVYAKLLEATPEPDATPETSGDVIVIRSQTGSNGQHG